jgi:hypothetical protein
MPDSVGNLESTTPRHLLSGTARESLDEGSSRVDRSLPAGQQLRRSATKKPTARTCAGCPLSHGTGSRSQILNEATHSRPAGCPFRDPQPDTLYRSAARRRGTARRDPSLSGSPPTKVISGLTTAAHAVNVGSRQVLGEGNTAGGWSSCVAQCVQSERGAVPVDPVRCMD